MKLEYSASSTANPAVGNTGNEDAYLLPEGVREGEASDYGWLEDAGSALFAISDGIHCSPQAEIASRRLLELLASAHEAMADEPIGRKLRTVHERFTECASEQRNLFGMTATLVAAEIGPARATVYNVGDSPAWLVHENEATRLTRDHTILQRMLDEGDVSPEEAEGLASIYDGLDRYFAAIPGEGKPMHDQLGVKIEAGDTLVLASDGLSVLEPEVIALRCRDEFRAISARLIEDAIAGGSDDNITVVALRPSAG